LAEEALSHIAQLTQLRDREKLRFNTPVMVRMKRNLERVMPIKAMIYVRMKLTILTNVFAKIQLTSPLAITILIF